MKFIGNIRIINEDGTISSQGNNLIIRDASVAYIYIDIRTNFKTNVDPQSVCRNTTKNASQKNFSDIETNHVADYQNLFKRVELFLGQSETENLPTDLRWLLVKEGKNDVGIDALFFQYARYLIIASSRQNSPLPANLQGLWNDNLANNMGWTCDYHLDINTEQNYWLTNIGNLSECNTPLFKYLADLSYFGQKTAKEIYGARGWTAHTMTNVWGFTAPGWDVSWGLFPTGGTWLASHLWNHFLYTQDIDFLKNIAYPILKSNAEFFLDYMVMDQKTGYIVTGPSTSPENAFKYNNQIMSLSMMPTVDKILVSELFNSVIESSKILKIDQQFADSLQNKLVKFPPYAISKKYGGIQEWLEDYEEAYPNHRHTSHLLGLYPFSQITLDKTPALAQAAKVSLERRLSDPKWEDVEWSRANMICFNARLKDPKEAYKSLVLLQRNFTRENLLTISPKGIAGAPYDIFVFDGNEAGAAGIAEMLLQSHSGYIEFLPALPTEWETGFFRGLCVQGGGVVDIEWKNMKVVTAVIKAISDHTFYIKVKDNDAIPQLIKNGKRILLKQKENNLISFSLKKGETIIIKF